MKVLHNNQLNKVLFIYNNENLAGSFIAEFTQAGSEKTTSLSAVIDFSDCYTVLFAITLPDNSLQNARHLLKIKNQNGETLFTSTVKVDGNTDETKAYVVFEDN